MESPNFLRSSKKGESDTDTALLLTETFFDVLCLKPILIDNSTFVRIPRRLLQRQRATRDQGTSPCRR